MANTPDTVNPAPRNPIDADTVRKLARLSQLALDDDEVNALVPELHAIVDHVRQLQAVDTEGLTPMTHGHPAGAILQTPSTSTPSTSVLGRQAVNQSAGYDDEDGTVRVPKVVDGAH